MRENAKIAAKLGGKMQAMEQQKNSEHMAIDSNFECISFQREITDPAPWDYNVQHETIKRFAKYLAKRGGFEEVLEQQGMFDVEIHADLCMMVNNFLDKERLF